MSTSAPTIILDDIQTAEQGAILTLILSDIIHMEFAFHLSLDTLKKDFDPESMLLFERFCQKNNIDPSSKEPLIAFAKIAKETLQHLPTITCTLPFNPSATLIQNMYEKIFQIMQKPFLLTVTIDTTIIGGLQFALDGKFHDYSIKKNAEHIIQKYL